MNRRQFLAGMATSAAWEVLPRTSRAAPDKRETKLRRGVAIAGAEFGVGPQFSNLRPGVAGKDYTYNSEQTVAYFAEQGVTLLRVPFRWERIQPRLGEPLNESELDRLRKFVGWARKHACHTILDVHNFARYTLLLGGKPRDCLIDATLGDRVPVTRAHFADLWSRLSAAFADEPAVEAYGLMNEPHDMGASDWKAISQAAVDAIRARGDRKQILVPGESWSNSDHFIDVNGPQAWIRDPLGRTAYEAHCYFDSDYSGNYRQSYDEELSRDPDLEQRGVKRPKQFFEWLRTNEVPGLVGEFGVPPEPRWLEVMRHFLQALDEAGIEGCYWAAGEWFGAYPLSIQPGLARRRKPQLDVLVGERADGAG